MRITELRVTPVAIGDPPLRNIWGVHEPYGTRSVVQLFTDEGLVGLGEGYASAAALGQLAAARRLVEGMDPFQVEPLRQQLNDPRTFSAIEVALLDLQGKATGRPVCDLLGGRMRGEVEFSAYLFYKFAGDDDWGEVLTPEAMVGEAQRFARDYGFGVFKLKGGVLPPEQEVETLRQMRAALGPAAGLRIDPNCGWSVETSIRMGREMLPIGIEYYEDPTGGIEGMAAVRRAVPELAYATNMCVTAWEHLAPAVRQGPIDVLLSDHHYWGGLVESVRLSRLSGALGWKVSMHSNTHLGISLAAMVHLAAAMPCLDYACDTHYPWATEDVVAGRPFVFRDGKLPVPTAPGLGVTLDEDKLARLHEQYRRVGTADRDDAGWMRKHYDPTWERRVPRW